MSWLVNFSALLSIRWKIFAASAAVIATGIFGLLALYRHSVRRAKTAEARTKQLEAIRKIENDIAKKQDELRLRQVRLRKELLARKERDLFENGWGP